MPSNKRRSYEAVRVRTSKEPPPGSYVITSRNSLAMWDRFKRLAQKRGDPIFQAEYQKGPYVPMRPDFDTEPIAGMTLFKGLRTPDPTTGQRGGGFPLSFATEREAVDALWEDYHEDDDWQATTYLPSF